jgi:hypothetical protein
MNLPQPQPDLDLPKFHWDKWQSESRGFWRRATSSSVLLVLLILHQFGTIDWKSEWFNFSASAANAFHLNRLLFNPLSWCLLSYVLFGFIDLLRHRVPDDLEPSVHNNTIKIKIGPFNRTRNLKTLGHGLYLIVFFLYFGLLAFWLIAATCHVWK